MSTEVTQEPTTPAELADLINSFVALADDYDSAADAMWRAALAAFDYAARGVGATGFQASWAALRFYREAEHVDSPFLVMRLEDALYPQYDLLGRLAGFLEENRDWLREQATKKLAEYEARPTFAYTDADGNEVTAPTAAPSVVEHWRKLVES